MFKNILFLLGLAFLFAGIVAGNIIDKWLPIPVILLILGTSLIIIGIFFILREQKNIWFGRSSQIITNALISMIAIFVIVGLINFLAVKHNVRWDLTENKLFTLSPQSQTIVQNLSQPLKVWVFDRNVNPELKTLLENYRRYGNNFQFQFVDPEKEIGLAQKFSVQSLSEIHLEYDDKKQRLNIQPTELNSGLTETELTNAIENIKRDRTINIYFLQGHGEAPLEAVQGGISQAVASLEAKGYQVKNLNLANSSKVPDGTNVIVIAGAIRSLFPAEVNSLQQYLNNGGNMLLMLSPTTDPGLTPLLKEWGIKLDNRLIIDVSGKGNILGLGPAAPIIDSYGDHPITKSFRNGLSIFPESRPIIAEEKNHITKVPLVVTNDKSWAESDLTNPEIVFDAKKDFSGPLNIAIAFTKERDKSDSRLVVFGSSTFATNGWFEQQLNGDIFLNSIDWLLGENEQNLSIRPKEQANRRINLNPLQAGLIVWLALIILPVLALATAIVLWWKRR